MRTRAAGKPRGELPASNLLVVPAKVGTHTALPRNRPWRHEIGMAIAAMRQRFGRPVWVVGTSNGSLSVASAVAQLRGTQRPDGAVFTSSVTQPTRRNGSVFDVALASYTGAALVASHES